MSDPAADYRQAREAAALFDVSDRGKVEVTGADAAAFLHNLTSNDVLGLAPGSGREMFLCTAKAKAVAHGLLYRVRDGDREAFWLDLPPGLAEKVVKHLDRFLISEQVELLDRTADFAQFHLAGPQARAVVQKAFGDVPELAPLQHAARAGCTVRRNDALGVPGYDILCPRGEAERVRRALLDAGVRPAGPEAYEVLRVEAGTPVYGVDIDENRSAFEAGRTAQAISYTKGCYLGQEPIVMARDRGHANRTLLGLKVSGDTAVPHGAKVFRDGNEVGQVTSSAVSPRLGAIALAYLRRGSWEPGTAVEVEAEGARRAAAVASLPFPG
jgi:folate-binding protein YgfZ